MDYYLHSAYIFQFSSSTKKIEYLGGEVAAEPLSGQDGGHKLVPGHAPVLVCVHLTEGEAGQLLLPLLVPRGVDEKLVKIWHQSHHVVLEYKYLHSNIWIKV